MPKATQVTLNLRNEIGVLAKLCRDLADGGVNLLGLTAPDAVSDGAGAIRLLVANQEHATGALKKAGYDFSVEEVIFVELKNRPGAFARTVEKLARAQIDVRYVYATAYTRAQKTAAVIAVDQRDLPKAAKLVG